jgi:hypothetical protein
MTIPDQLKPMSEEEIKAQVAYFTCRAGTEYADRVDKAELRIILAWVHERTSRARLQHDNGGCELCINAYHEKDRCEKSRWTDVDWLTAFKERVGWRD